MRAVHTVAEVRAAEAALMATLPDGVLMQRAAHPLSVHCENLLGRVYGAQVVLLVGSGSNGGDALFAGARLARLGAQVHAVLLKPERAHGAGLAEFRRRSRRIHADGASRSTLDLVAAADLVVDGIVGIGGRGELRGDAIALADVARDALTVAVDVPSGVDADTGWIGEHAIRADATVTFGTLKQGLVSGAGRAKVGEIRLVDIGLGPHLPDSRAAVLEGADIAALIPTPGPADDKYTRGVVGVVAGSGQYPGAGVLATGSALHGGAGMVRYLGLAAEQIHARYPEVVGHQDVLPHDVKVQAWVVGPGLGTDDRAMSLLTDVLRSDVPVIVDADAITLVARTPAMVRDRSAPTVLTPHDREFTRLPVELSADRLDSVRRAAAELGVTMLLKGDATVIADARGQAYVNTTGTPWLATAGSGDVLSGLIGALLAAGLDAPLAAAVGAHVHGVAGQLAAADGPPSAGDVLEAIRPALRAVRRLP
jgi:ADP-dependent NAD(P)H-hydrate dehydratase / NAD(P)H-hydrate epimerase